MKKFLLPLVALLAAVVCAQGAEPLRVFIRAGVKTHGPNQHDHPRFLREWKELLTARGMRADGAMNFPSPAQLENTDVLIIYAQDGMKIVGDERAALEKFLSRGGGLIVIHAAIASGGEHEWCKSIVGGAWRWPAPDVPKEKASKWLEGDVGLYWLDTEHPISRGLSNFDWKDEIYYDLDVSPEVHVLASSFHNIHIIAPQIWTYEKTLPGGMSPYRALVSLPGHEYEVFNTPQYRAVLLRGIAWTGKRANTDEFCSAAELSSLCYPPGGPRPASEALKSFILHPEFDISLVADENVAEKIMSLDWDLRGRLWVVETPEYPGGRDIAANDTKIAPWRAREPEKFPIGAKEPRKPRDRISILEDTDGDGVMDKKSVFADGLELPTSLVFYRDGVIVAQAPDIFWIRDTNGDGKADKREILFTGWGTHDTHAVISNFRWGPDGWIYGSVGYSAGDVTSGDSAKKFGRIPAGIYRFRPDGSALEQVAAGSCNTWGCEIAPDGEVFFSTATCGEPIVHVVLPEKVISRSGMSGVRAAKPIVAENKVYPPRTEERQPYVQIDWVGQFTAASGACIYDGGAWPEKWQGPPWAFFVHEPTVWLVHQEFLEPSGASYQGRREPGREQKHFLTSADYWFKPIHSRVGPDGALYLVDFYNQIAVHNDTRGPPHGARNAATRPDRDHRFTRLYRIQHKEAKPLPPFQLLSRNPERLVAMLGHPNGWVRTTANRLLSESGNKKLAKPFNKMASADDAYGRVQALWVLHNLKLLDDKVLIAGIGDAYPAVRKNALRIVSEREKGPFQFPAGMAQKLLADSDARVRIAALVAAASLDANNEWVNAIVSAWPSFDNPHLQAAALAVSSKDPLRFIRAALDNARDDSLVSQLARQVANKNDPTAARSLVMTLAEKPEAGNPLKVAALQALSSAMKKDVRPTPDDALVQAVNKLLATEATASATLPLAVRWDFVDRVGDSAKKPIANAINKLRDKALSDEERAQVAANLLAVRALDSNIVPTVTAIATGDASPALKQRVIEALGATDDSAAGDALLSALPSLDGELRHIAFGQLLKRVDWSERVVEALASGKLPLDVLDLGSQHRLRTHGNTAVARRASEVIAALRGPEQKEKDLLIAKLRSYIGKPGDLANGAKLFTQHCAPCHKFKDAGADFAPNLTGMGAHGPEDLLVHIIDPNRVVEPNYTAVSIETKDDLNYDGIVLRENKSVVVIRNQTAETEIRKENIRSRRNSTRSIMPEGFEQLGAENLRDLLAFLCADEQRFRILDLSGAFTADGSRGVYRSIESREESLSFKKWGTIKHRDVPFDIVHPQRTASGKNLIVLQGGEGMARSYPREVEIKVGLPVTELHFLGGVGGWAFPLGRKDEPVAKVIVHFASGGTEEIVLRNGVEFADYIRPIDVPGSEPLEKLGDLLSYGRQIRYFSKPLSKRGVVGKLTLASYSDEVAPTFVAITAELDGAATKPSQLPAAVSFQWGVGLKVLIIGGGASHDYERWFHQEDTKTLNEVPGISANYTETTVGLADVIAGVDVLIVGNNKPFGDDATKEAIVRHVKSGKGLVGLHPGLWYNWRDWPEYNRDLVGGGSRGHDKLGEFEVCVTEPAHPLMRGVPATFRIKDELYWFEPDPNGPGIHPLATAFSEKNKMPYPQVFTVEHATGRVVGLTLGHDGDAHTHPAYKELLRNAVLWSAGKETAAPREAQR